MKQRDTNTPNVLSPLQTAAEYLAKNDLVLAPVIEMAELPSFTPHTNYYEALVSSIIGQQLSIKAAAAIERRFTESFDGRFPSPQEIITRTIDELRLVGLSRPKAAYIQDLARRIIDGTVQFDGFDKLSNQEIITELTKVKGIGEWTVQMFLIFCMGRLDVLPTGDLGIRNGIKTLYKLTDLPTPQDIEAIAAANRWHPYESAASWYIWQSLTLTPKIAAP